MSSRHIFLGVFDSIFTNDQRRLVVVLDSQISIFACLIFVTHRDDISPIPARRGRQPVALVGGAGAAPEGSASSAGPPGALGDIARPNYVGPSGNGLVERMKAGETPWNQGRS